jgi:hypothetical protein
MPFSPWVDMEVIGESYDTNRDREPFFYRVSVRQFAATFLGEGGDLRNPLANPLYADLSGLGPIYIQVGGDETLLDAAREGLRLALIASLQYLHPRQRAVLILREMLAFPATEVATMLDTTTAAVKSALQRARARLDQAAPGREQLSEPTEPHARALLDQYIAAFGLGVLTVTDAGIARIVVFGGGPDLVAKFGLPPVHPGVEAPLSTQR